MFLNLLIILYFACAWSVWCVHTGDCIGLPAVLMQSVLMRLHLLLLLDWSELSVSKPIASAQINGSTIVCVITGRALCTVSARYPQGPISPRVRGLGLGLGLDLGDIGPWGYWTASLCTSTHLRRAAKKAIIDIKLNCTAPSVSHRVVVIVIIVIIIIVNNF